MESSTPGAGPLYATADADDDHHEACRRALWRGDLRLVVPALVVAEATTSSADASIVTLAERIGADLVITLDRPHFDAIKPRHIDTFELLP